MHANLFGPKSADLYLKKKPYNCTILTFINFYIKINPGTKLQRIFFFRNSIFSYLKFKEVR